MILFGITHNWCFFIKRVITDIEHQLQRIITTYNKGLVHATTRVRLSEANLASL